MTRPAAPPAKAKPKSLARLSALRQARPYRLRLVDGAALAAAGLLVLKLAAIAVAETPPPLPGAPLPEFARALAKARSNYEPIDPLTTGSVTAKEKEAPAPPAAPEPAMKPKAPPPPEPMPASERAILERLSARRDALKARNDALDLREKTLGAAERKLGEAAEELEKGEDEAGGGGGAAGDSEKAGLKNIVTMYETMKPKDAARVFDRLALEVLTPIVLAMSPRKMADVLALMQSEPAEKLTVALASRARGRGPGQPAVAGLPSGELQAIDPMERPDARR